MNSISGTSSASLRAVNADIELLSQGVDLRLVAKQSAGVASVLVEQTPSKSITSTAVLPEPTVPPAASVHQGTPVPPSLASLLNVQFGGNTATAARQVEAQTASTPPPADGIILSGATLRQATIGEQALLDSMAQAASDFNGLDPRTMEVEAKRNGISPDSWPLLEEVSRQFVMLTAGKAFCAYERDTGIEHSEAGFSQLVRKRLGHLTVVDDEGKEQQGQLGKVWWYGDFHHKRVVTSVVMEPTELSAVDDAERSPNKLNRWHALKATMATPTQSAALEDIQILLDHLMYLSDGDQVGVLYFLNWLAQLYQTPGIKIPSAVLMYSEFGGVGKSMLYTLLSRVFGSPMVACCKGRDLQKGFDDVVEHKRLVFVNEMARSDKADNYENFKSNVSEPEAAFEGKGRAARHIRNITHFIVTTNHKDALPLMKGDRRICVLMCTAARKPDAYYQKLIPWMENEGPALLAGVLVQWQFPAGWDPYAPVPQTKAARTLQDVAQGELKTLVSAMVEAHEAPFDKDLIKVVDACRMLNATHKDVLARPANLTTLGSVLKDLVGEPISLRVGTAPPAYFYCLRNAEQWKAASPAQRHDHCHTGKRIFPVQPDEVASNE
ncbi:MULTISPECIES: primase-helicase family protein [Pseudomonas]|uniref:primase-helicase family protein n=1 Tax=Pseudomonas TaxID=286 RepID=UPI001AE68D92|nr:MULTISPECIES: primase-helicase family protein [Pseudomonas]MBP2083526.1 hypothetical protein [Pseudomonas sp. PvP089]MBP2090771.1 hypothetical protein [Pseudomonas sp. PvP088]MBP2223065.1 hypothetical protein [Pseudomonas putida]